MQIEIREPRDERELEAYFRLRYEELRKPFGFPPGSERRDELEAASTHLIAVSNGSILGAAAMIAGMGRDEATGKRHVYVRWRNIAIAPQAQRAGVGAALYAEVERRARALGAARIVVNARDEKLAFYERLGFRHTGPGEQVMGLPHTELAKEL